MRWALSLLGLCLCAPINAADQVALVIGNAAYQVGHLKNPVNDADDMAAALRAIGFEVVLGTNLDRAQMLRKLGEFQELLVPGGLAVVYYSGHGVEVDGQNWLLPVSNAEIHTQADVPIYSVSAQDVLRKLEESGSKLNLLILDACRNNPLPAGNRSLNRGLSVIQAGKATLVAYATAPGMTAADGDDRNSPYTAILKDVIQTPGLSVSDLFNQVGAQVQSNTDGAQVPWNSSTPIWPPIYLAGSGSTIPLPLPDGNALGELRIEVSPEDAEVYVDGARVGRGDQTLRSLPPNTKPQVEARRSGYKTQDITAYIKAGEATVVRLRLTALQTTGNNQGNSPGDAIQHPLRTGGLGPVMVVIPAGRFSMGSPQSETGRNADEGPQRTVSIAGFALGKHEVTFDDWALCVAAGGCGQLPGDEGWGGGSRPVINVTWDDTQAYVRWLSVESGRQYRLPSEAEWEYAARAQTTTAFWWGQQGSHEYANFGTDECCNGKIGGRDQWEFTAPVGQFPPNAFGLHDTQGNVWEWVQDCYQDSYVNAPLDSSPVDLPNCKRRVLRGAAWLYAPARLRSAARSAFEPNRHSSSMGFRVAVEN